MTIEAVDHSDFAEVVNGADMVCADGMPLAKAVKLIYGQKIDRVAGMDMFPDLIQAADEQNLSIFLFGSTDEVLAKIKKKITTKYPAVKLVGAVSPPFRSLSDEEEAEYIKQINDSGAKMVFVALGCPKQEKWMAKHSKNINAVLLGVGGAFPVFVNEQKRAPKWMQNMSLEWLYRLIQDPKRLFKRYFYTNTKFLFLLGIQFLKGKQ
jgi:N-acetylglucosaminyldiphosphoundecaprenol N-acetyl-beta-D-mannosaminyltransferase